MEKKGLKPDLRFQEYTESWEQKRFDQLGEDFGYGMNAAATKYDGKHKYIRITDIDEDSRIFIPKPLTSPDGKVGEKFQLSNGDILFARTGASVGKSYHYSEADGRVFYAGFLIKAHVSRAVSKFIFYYTLTGMYNKWVQVMSMRSGQPGLNAEEYKSWVLAIPSLPEQQKIATFLTSVDKRIQLLQTKKEKLEEYKKGVMQKIFSQEIRFKDENGNPFPEWEEKKFNQLYTFFRTNSLSRDKLNYTEGRVKNVHYGDIHTKFKRLLDISKEIVPFVNLDVDLSKIIESDFLMDGDLIIADASEDYKDIGKTSEVINTNGEKVLSGLHTFLARKQSDEIVTGFTTYLLQTWNVRYQVMRIAQGTKVLSLSAGRLGNVLLVLPSIKEQDKIVNFLTSIDESIEKVIQQIEGSKAFKKGLLQKMFI